VQPSSCSGSSQKAFAQPTCAIHLAALSAAIRDAISQSAITLSSCAAWRLHGLIERLPTASRYRVTEFGFRAALFFTRLYNRCCAQASPLRFRPSAPSTGPLKRAFDTVNAQINVSIKQAQLAT